MSDYPKMIFADELAASIMQAEHALMTMVMGSIEVGEMPPSDLFAWYVKHVTLRFIMLEYQAVYYGDDTFSEELEVIRSELDVVRDLLITNKQLGLQAEVEKMLKTRMLHLPEGYIHAKSVSVDS